MGQDWEAALLACMVCALDRLHMLNHLNGNCLSELHPDKYPQLCGKNTQSAEQTNSIKQVNSVTQKNGGGFRFHNMRMADVRNSQLVKRDRHDDKTRHKSGQHDKAYFDKLKKIKAAESYYAKKVPDVPPEYLGTVDPTGSPFVTHIDGARFKAEWDSGRVRDSPQVKASRELGVNFRAKKTLRRKLMDFVVRNGIAVTKATRKSDGLVH
jgi:hypothetical protein